MPTLGVFDAENLWVAAQRYALPTLAYPSPVPLESAPELHQLMREYPKILAKVVRQVCERYDDSKVKLKAVGMFEHMHDKQLVEVKQSFAGAGFEVKDPGGRPDSNRSDPFIVAEATRIIA